jgi:hypothetical protein
MALTYTWAITSLKKTSEGEIQNAVVQTHWTCTGTDEDGDSGVFNGATPFPLSAVDPATFVPYEELTEADVIAWVEAVVVGAYKEHVDAQIMKQIALKKHPVEEVPSNELPWSPPAEEGAAPETPEV